jgi:hypothetical protein
MAVLVNHIRNRARTIINSTANEDPNKPGYTEAMDDAELLQVLARILEGRTIKEAFGAPGDWGYGTPIGDAVAGREHAAQTRGAFENAQF